MLKLQQNTALYWGINNKGWTELSTNKLLKYFISLKINVKHEILYKLQN